MKPELLLSKVVEGGMLCFPRAVTLCHLLLQTRDVPGDVVEFGCYQGNTARLMASLMLPEKDLWLYDSFDGLPKPGERDGKAPQYQEGAMKADETSLDGFRTAGLMPPFTVCGWFKDIRPNHLPKRISFAHLDGDLYASIRDSLALVYPRMSAGAICVIDDYGNPELPGVQKAVEATKVPLFRNVSGAIGCEDVQLNPVAHQAWFVKL